MRQSISRFDAAGVIWLNRAVSRRAWLRLSVSGLAGGLAGVEIGLMLLLVLAGRRQSALRMLCAVGLVYLACDALGLISRRGRPFKQHPEVQPLLEHSAGRSFPSRHVASGLAMAAIGARAHPRLGTAMTLVACLLGLTRVAAGLHYPSDVLAGAALGRWIGNSFAQRA